MSQNNSKEIFQSESGERDVFSVDLLELAYWIADRYKRIIAAALAGALLMAAYSFLIAKPVYSATSTLYVLNSSDSAINLSDLQIGAYLTSDYQEVFDVWEIHEMVLQKLNLNYTYKQTRSMLKVTNPNNTRMLHINVESGDPQEAADMANAFASVASDYISMTMMTDAPSLVSQALRPEEPIRPRKKINVLLGLMAGGFLMTLALLVQFILDDKIKTGEDITRYLDIPMMAIVPKNQPAPEKHRKSGGAE